MDHFDNDLPEGEHIFDRAINKTFCDHESDLCAPPILSAIAREAAKSIKHAAAARIARRHGGTANVERIHRTPLASVASMCLERIRVTCENDRRDVSAWQRS